MEDEEQKQQASTLKSSTTEDNNGCSTSEDVDEFGEYLGNSNESLLSLVQPEMKQLSRHWLAALKDHALLSLPAGQFTPFSTMLLLLLLLLFRY